VHASKDRLYLRHLSSVLAQHNALTRFGVALFSPYIVGAESEFLLEQANAADRVLNSEVVRRADGEPRALFG
jgi:hypothetical protein